MSSVYLLNDVFTLEECKDEITFAEKVGFIEQKYGVTHAVEARRRATTDNPKRAEQIWNKIKVIPKLDEFYQGFKPWGEGGNKTVSDLSRWSPIGLNARLRYYQYEPGQRFSKHYDIMFRVNDDTRTFLTFIIYLNDDFEGGQTKFDNETVVPKIGSAIIFPHELRHEGLAVTKGCKTVLRSDIMYSRL